MRPSSAHSTAAWSSLTQYPPPEWSSPCERPVVPEARSPFSTRTASIPRSARSRSTPAPVDPPPITTTPVLVSGIQQKGERTNAALSPHPSAPFYDFAPAPTASRVGSFSTQPSVRSTAFFQPASPAWRCSSVDCGSKTLSTCQFLRSSSSVLQNPVANPAP